ncbi:MAG TPA: MaoC family dehydratase N-terminal domain-containing protein [Burkholderiaceae bacterium]|nr:MaoC family dehydratase N-terminal domain-containing protein [Burkholderiaceae bacterium]
MAGESKAGSTGGETVSFEGLRDWIGRSEQREDVVTAQPVAALGATFDRDEPTPRNGDELPPLWHWLYFLPQHRRSELGADGHAKLGGFLPPVPLPRRMWAGSRLEFHRPLRVGEPISRVSRIADVTSKSGRSGQLVFVKVHHRISGPDGLAISEEHDIVYREALVAGGAGQPAPAHAAVAAAAVAQAAAQSAGEQTGDAPADPAWTREIDPDPVLLFRYSALTFNGHRIHYDRSWATDVEGYPGLVVHGPMIATLLLEHLRDRLAAQGGAPRRITHFRFQARNPIFDTERFSVCAEAQGEPNTYRLWARKAGQVLCMDASATVA